MNQSISTRAHQKRLAPRLLCVMIGAALGTLSASAWAATTTDTASENVKKTSAATDTAKSDESKKSDTITVVGTQDTFRAGGNDLIPTYLDGQVANGGRIGFPRAARCP
ncbi:ferrichrome receptor protein [Yersinia aleksiciae]|uniref:Ferrichrome receptor protein n=1 Tax=Yersinia aleksiciae TaxID=263819 RepID=A0A0T9UZ67_YERAE|nr:ferrichrome receptor protein [Yersinia aleksiciae]